MSNPIVQPIALESTVSAPQGDPLVKLPGILQDVEVSLEFRLGTASLSAKELMDWKTGSTVKLHQQVGAPVDVLLNQKVIARGMIVAVEDHFGVRITDILAPAA